MLPFDVSIADENLSSLLKPLPLIKQTPPPPPLKKIIEEKIKQIPLFPPLENHRGLADSNLPIKRKQKGWVFICFWSRRIVYTGAIFNLKINFNFASSTSKLGYTPKMWYLRSWTLFKYRKYTQPSYYDHNYSNYSRFYFRWLNFKKYSLLYLWLLLNFSLP